MALCNHDAMEPVAESILTWLRKGGFPLEYHTARVLRAAGFFADQGQHYLDPVQQGTNRETDVVAWLHEDVPVLVAMVIECKAASDKPWVALTTTTIQGTDRSGYQGRAANDALGSGWIGVDLITKKLPLPDRYAFTVVEAHNDRNDRAHSALEQVISAAVGIAAGYGYGNHLVVLPV